MPKPDWLEKRTDHETPELTDWDLQAVEDAILRRDATEAAAESRATEWLPEWMLGVRLQIDAERAGIQAEYNLAVAILTEQLRRRMRPVDARERALCARWQSEFEIQVDADISAQRGTRKSFDYPSGRAGRRHVKDMLEITDDKVALQWALENAPEACQAVLARKGPLTDWFKEHGEIPPGCILIDEHEKFYPQSKLEPAEPTKEEGQDGREDDSSV